MSKWTGSETGILRKSEFKEKKEELFVFGYSCKLFRDDDKALLIDQGKHLIPWMGDESLKIDRYDARGALHDLSALEAPPGGFDWRVELTKTEQEVEHLCDEERYRALHTDEDEEEMYKEEELKRLHAAGYGQVGFNYDTPSAPAASSQLVEVDDPFLPTDEFKALLPPDVVIPEGMKQNAIIEKTAKFIASQGAQMEILIKAKQGDNPQFQFLNKGAPLNTYYMALIGLVKAGKWPEKAPEVVEVEKPPENEEYLHPSLAATVIESAPSIPSIAYKPSADCDYRLLVSRVRGWGGAAGWGGELAPGEVAPPGTEHHHYATEPPPPALPPAQYQQAPVYYTIPPPTLAPLPPALPPVPPVLPPSLVTKPPPVAPPPPTPLQSVGLSLMMNYDSDSNSETSDTDDSSPRPPTPPPEIQVVVAKMAAYVSRNGAPFAETVRAKRDPRFSFLEPGDPHHAYYRALVERGAPSRKGVPVSFSIKKLKEPDPILPKPALPYESSSDDESDKQADKQTDKPEEMEPPKPTHAQLVPMNQVPPVVVYKMENKLTNNVPSVTKMEPTVHPMTIVPYVGPAPSSTLANSVANSTSTVTPIKVVEVAKVPKVEPSKPLQEKPKEVRPEPPIVEEKKEEVPKYEKRRERVSAPVHRREKKKHRDKKKEYKTRSLSRETRRRSVEKEKKREKENNREKKKRRYSRDDLENEIISLEDNSDEMIDLTGDLSDAKVEGDPEESQEKQRARRRRAAEFLRRVGVDPAAATALPATSLASAMVDTLESIRKKKAEEEEKRRRHYKRRREKREYAEAERSHRKSKRRKNRSSDDNDESDVEGSKKKKRKKDKKHSSKNKKRRRREPIDEEVEEFDLPNIDLTNTLKELRTASPTKEIVLQNIEDNSQVAQDSSSGEEIVRDRRKKKEREYSEGEWSSDSEKDSDSTLSRDA